MSLFGLRSFLTQYPDLELDLVVNSGLFRQRTSFVPFATTRAKIFSYSGRPFEALHSLQKSQRTPQGPKAHSEKAAQDSTKTFWMRLLFVFAIAAADLTLFSFRAVSSTR